MSTLIVITQKEQETQYYIKQHRDHEPTFTYSGQPQPGEFTKEQKCHQTFKTSCYENHKDRNPSRVAGTCCWVLNHPQFHQWRTDPHSPLLWISADPGCGKSVLSKALVDEGLCSDDSTTMCYFFFKDNEEQDNLPTALCALLHQLFSHKPHLLRHAMPAWEKNGDKLCGESLHMWQILQTAAVDHNAGPIVFVMDALDECKDADRCQLIQLLCDLQQRTENSRFTGRLKILVTSRPYDNVQRWFEHTASTWPNIRLRGEDENDTIHEEINLVIKQQVHDIARESSLAIDVRDRVQQQLLNMQHRTYLWLHLAMEEVREICRFSICSDDVQVISLPTSVEDAYERILRKINARQSKLARQILLIIVGARRPLSLEEMALALSAARASEQTQSRLSPVDPARLRKHIPELCGLFVYINHSQLFLIHQTAKEFLVAQRSWPEQSFPPWKSCLLETQIELEMTNICVTYLHLRGIDYVERGYCPRGRRRTAVNAAYGGFAEGGAGFRWILAVLRGILDISSKG